MMMISELLNKFKSWLDSDEGVMETNDYFDKINIRRNIESKQIERFRLANNFENFTEKVIKKYNSDEYRNRWYNRNIEPPEDLYWFLFYYASEYGRKCNKEEWDQYGSIFTTDLIFYSGYYFNKMDGQGSVIQVFKE